MRFHLPNALNVHLRLVDLFTCFYCLVAVMLADALFANPERMLSEQLEQYAYLYSYASVTAEEINSDTESRVDLDRSLVPEVTREVLEASRICKYVSHRRLTLTSTLAN